MIFIFIVWEGEVMGKSKMTLELPAPMIHTANYILVVTAYFKVPLFFVCWAVCSHQYGK